MLVLEEFAVLGVAATVADTPVDVVGLSVVDVEDGTVSVEDGTEVVPEEAGADEDVVEGCADEDAAEDDAEEEGAEEEGEEEEGARAEAGADEDGAEEDGDVDEGTAFDFEAW